jgi:hypothetical protein
MIDNFIPEFWASIVLEAAQKGMVYAQDKVINRNYEGEFAAKGDTVHIIGVGDVTVVDTADGTDQAEGDEMLDADTILTISQDKTFRFLVYDKQKKQAGGDILSPYMRRAAYRIKDATDQYVAGMYVDASSANKIGTDASPKVPNTTAGDAQNVFNLIEDCSVLLSNNNVPTDGRWMIVPPWFSGLIVKDYHREGASAPGLSEIAHLTGKIAHIAGFDILESNNVPNTSLTKYKIMFGNDDAITFADSLAGIEPLRHQKRWADIVRGRHVYGGKVAYPDNLGVLTVNSS